MKKKYLFILMLLGIGVTGSRAQNAVVASGGNAIGSGGSVSYSVGQVAYASVTGSSGTSNQGVQQPYELYVGIDENEEITITFTVFPNPAQSTVNLLVENQSLENFSFRLYDAGGKLIVSQKIISMLTQIPINMQATGIYLLNVLHAKKAVKSFTIIKNN